jgi:hypothetical protein
VPRPAASTTALVCAVVATIMGACSSPEPDRVIVDAGTVPAEVTATTAAEPDEDPEATTTTTALGPATLSASSAVTTAGVDDVAFGMSLSEAQRAAGSRILPEQDGHDPDCYVAVLEDGPGGLRLTFAAGVFERLDVVEGAIATRSGAGIGDTADQLQDLFGDQLEAGTDAAGNPTLTFVPIDESDAGTLIVFTLADDRVTEMRAGRRPIVETGCR